MSAFLHCPKRMHSAVPVRPQKAKSRGAFHAGSLDLKPHLEWYQNMNMGWALTIPCDQSRDLPCESSDDLLKARVVLGIPVRCKLKHGQEWFIPVYRLAWIQSGFIKVLGRGDLPLEWWRSIRYLVTVPCVYQKMDKYMNTECVGKLGKNGNRMTVTFMHDQWLGKRQCFREFEVRHYNQSMDGIGRQSASTNYKTFGVASWPRQFVNTSQGKTSTHATYNSHQQIGGPSETGRCYYYEGSW